MENDEVFRATYTALGVSCPTGEGFKPIGRPSDLFFDSSKTGGLWS